MLKREVHIRGFIWLEVLLVLALASLFCILFPSVVERALSNVGLSTWPYSIRLIVNLLAIGVLLGIRFGPQLFDEWRQRRRRFAIDLEKQEEERKLREQRELFERLHEARKRQVV